MRPYPLHPHLVNCRNHGLYIRTIVPPSTSPNPLYPLNASVKSRSARKFASTSRTPCSPPNARPHIYGRPNRTADAPNAIALITSEAQRIPLSNRIGALPCTTFAIPGSASSAAIAPSTCRPPWLETITPSTPHPAP